MNILVSSLPIREKYLPAYGGVEAVEFFDMIIDATKVFVDGYQREYYSDLIVMPKIIVVNDINELFSLIVGKSDEVIFFNLKPNDKSLSFLNEVKRKGVRVSVVNNKSVSRNPKSIFGFRFFVFILRYSWFFIYSRFSYSFVDVFYTNSLFYNYNTIRVFRPKKVVFVRHFDMSGVSPLKMNCNNRGGVFIDQYLPFHTEDVKGRERLDPFVYYSKVVELIDVLKEVYNLDSIVIARHPNSLGEELKYLNGLESSYGETKTLVENNMFIFGHFSNVINYAFILGKKVLLIDLDALPSYRRRSIQHLSEAVGYELVRFEDGKIVKCKKNFFRRFLSYLSYQIFYSAKSPCFIKAFKIEVTDSQIKRSL